MRCWCITQLVVAGPNVPDAALCTSAAVFVFQCCGLDVQRLSVRCEVCTYQESGGVSELEGKPIWLRPKKKYVTPNLHNMAPRAEPALLPSCSHAQGTLVETSLKPIDSDAALPVYNYRVETNPTIPPPVPLLRRTGHRPRFYWVQTGNCSTSLTINQAAAISGAGLSCAFHLHFICISFALFEIIWVHSAASLNICRTFRPAGPPIATCCLSAYCTTNQVVTKCSRVLPKNLPGKIVPDRHHTVNTEFFAWSAAVCRHICIFSGTKCPRA